MRIIAENHAERSENHARDCAPGSPGGHHLRTILRSAGNGIRRRGRSQPCVRTLHRGFCTAARCASGRFFSHGYHRDQRTCRAHRRYPRRSRAAILCASFIHSHPADRPDPARPGPAEIGKPDALYLKLCNDGLHQWGGNPTSLWPVTETHRLRRRVRLAMSSRRPGIGSFT